MFSFLKDIYQYLLVPNEDLMDTKEYRRLILIKLVLTLTTLILLFFAALHGFILENADKMIALIDLTTALLTLYALFSLKSSKEIAKSALISTTSLLIFFISFIYINQNDSFGLIWVIFFPIFALTINSTQKGLVFSLLFIFISSLMAFYGIGEWQYGYWDFKSFLRLTIALSIITLIMYMHEIAMEKVQEHEKDTLDFLEDLSLNDELTGIANRRRINSLLEIDYDKAKRYNTPFSIILFDIDHFKKVNDTYGHLAGDEVLKTLAKQINQSIRKTEMVGRWGGEEFILILSETRIDSAYIVAEKIRKTISKTQFKSIKGDLTCSFGIAEYQEGITIDELVDNADKALYQAKAHGRNTVVVYGQPDFLAD